VWPAGRLSGCGTDLGGVAGGFTASLLQVQRRLYTNNLSETQRLNNGPKVTFLRVSFVLGAGERNADGPLPPEPQQGLECRHRLLAPIMAKGEFVKISLELVAAHAVVGSEQPLLQVADGAVCQRHRGLCASVQVGSRGLSAGHMSKPCLLQSGEAVEGVGDTREPGATFCRRNAMRVPPRKSGMTAMRARPVARPRFAAAGRMQQNAL
jgi:hypothetical protein